MAQDVGAGSDVPWDGLYGLTYAPKNAARRKKGTHLQVDSCYGACTARYGRLSLTLLDAFAPDTSGAFS